MKKDIRIYRDCSCATTEVGEIRQQDKGFQVVPFEDEFKVEDHQDHLKITVYCVACRGEGCIDDDDIGIEQITGALEFQEKYMDTGEVISLADLRKLYDKAEALKVKFGKKKASPKETREFILEFLDLFYGFDENQ